jgi:hypothetical protein
MAAATESLSGASGETFSNLVAFARMSRKGSKRGSKEGFVGHQ